MIRIAISGAGAIAERAHIPAFNTIADARIVAIQSRTVESAERVVNTCWPSGDARPKVYSDFDQMLANEHPDAVCIFTPNYLHCEFTLKAIAAGAHVLVEKPMTTNVADARRMVDAAAKAGRVLMVAMQRRYGTLERAVKDAVASGAIGTPSFIRARLSHGGPGNWAPGQKWFTKAAEAGGGAMLDLGVHVADLAIWIMGEIDFVLGQIGTLVKPIEVEDTGVMILNFKSGALGVVEASWSSMPALSALEIYGSEGRVMVGYPRLDLAIQKADGTPARGFSREEITNRYNPRDLLAPFRDLAANFVGAIQGKLKPSPDGLDGLRSVEAIEACYRSSHTGSRIKLPLDS